MFKDLINKLTGKKEEAPSEGYPPLEMNQENVGKFLEQVEEA